jgi:hypothetical protein
MAIETIGEAYALGCGVSVRCSQGRDNEIAISSQSANFKKIEVALSERR